jgi:hypothetical protein
MKKSSTFLWQSELFHNLIAPHSTELAGSLKERTVADKFRKILA